MAPAACAATGGATTGRRTSQLLTLACALTLASGPLVADLASTQASSRSVVLVSTLAGAEHSVEQSVAHLGGRVLRRLQVIDGFVARVPANTLASIGHLAGVRWVTPNRQLALQSQYGADSGVASAVYTDVVRASKTWSFGTNGTGVTVALIDTGVNTTGDLAGQVLHAEDFTPEQDNQDSYGHGTFVAGLIDGTGAASSGAVRGVAPGAKLVSLKIAGRDGGTDVVKVLEALQWVVDFRAVYGIRIVNLSLGFQSKQSYLVDPLDFAVERVWNAGIVVVAAAGNGGSSSPSITDPGNDPMVITAGSDSDKTTLALSDDSVSSFSSSGPTVDGFAKPDVIAPGRSVVSSRSPGSAIDLANPNSEIGDSYAKASGTSFATGIVSGAAALVLSRMPILTPNQVKYRVVSTARPATATATPAGGAGVVDAFAATMSISLASANTGLTPSVGGGSLQATRGPACLVDSSGTCLSDADADALTGFDESEYFSDSWAGSQWAGSQWAGSQWAGSQWVGSQWVGSQWVGSEWMSAPSQEGDDR